jgi:8-oxo-dGTP pyrophosphatase MutT (NUDIX family)
VANDVADRPRLLGPDGNPIRINDRRSVAKAGQTSGLTPAPISGALTTEGMGSITSFGPGAPTRPWSGYSQRPRGFDYPAGVNITSTPRTGYGKPSFATLRAIIDAYDIARICINHKIDSLRSMEPMFLPADGCVEDVAGPIKAAKAALTKPDRDLPFDAWLSKWMEGWLRYDAATLYRRRNRAGQVMALEVLDGTCYSADTEVLTERGWIRFADADLATDRFATRDRKTHAFEWQPATASHEADWDASRGDVYHFTSTSLDLLVTPNHRMLVTSLPRSLGGSRHASGETFVRAEDLAGAIDGSSDKVMIPATSTWDAPDLATFRIPSTYSGRAARSFTTLTGDDFAAFMGMYLSEGSRNGKSAIHITQMESSKGYGPFGDLLTRILGRTPHRTNGVGWAFTNAGLSTYLEQFGHAPDKFIPREILDMSARQLEIFWRFYMLGDGCRSGGRQVIVTSSRRMADGLQEVAQKLGYSASVSRSSRRPSSTYRGATITATHDRYTVRLRPATAQMFHVAPQSYVGKVYCVSVPNETLYVRRNGKAAWCGNTITPFIDEYGRKPTAPAPAYGQIIKGTPQDWLTTDDLIYSPFRPQLDSPYGLAPIEAVMLTANTDLRFQWHFLQYFTDGSMPAGFLNTPPDSSSPDQVQEWQDYWDALMIGDQEVLRQIKVLPNGMNFSQTRDATFDEDFPLALIRRTCAAFGVVPNDLGLTMDVNLANGETQTDVQFRVNDRPVQMSVQSILTRYLQDDLGLPVKFTFDDGQEKEDRLAEAQAWQIYIEAGIASADEAREKLLGLPTDNTRPVPRFFVSSRQGPIPLVDIFSISGAIDPATGAPADDLPIPATQFPGDTGVIPDKLPADVNFTRAPVDIDDPAHPRNETGPVPSTGAIALPVQKEATAGVTAQTGITGMDLIGQDDDEDDEGDAPVVKAASEIAAFGRFVKARSREGRWRDFRFSTASPRTAHRLNVLGRAQIRKAAGELVAVGLAVLAADTGRVLMIQRAFDLADPASGRLEFPGGHLDPGEDPAAAAAREWYEEVGLTVPIDGQLRTGWTSANGVYQGFVYVVPCEAQVALDARNCSLNPDGDDFEAWLWVDPSDLPGNPAVRDELGADLDLVLAALEVDIGGGDPTPDVSLAKAGADPGPLLGQGDPRWHDVPGRRAVSASVDFHATKIAAATSGLLTAGVVRGLVDQYMAQQEHS